MSKLARLSRCTAQRICHSDRVLIQELSTKTQREREEAGVKGSQQHWSAEESLLHPPP